MWLWLWVSLSICFPCASFGTGYSYIDVNFALLQGFRWPGTRTCRSCRDRRCQSSCWRERMTTVCTPAGPLEQSCCPTILWVVLVTHQARWLASLSFPRNLGVFRVEICLLYKCIVPLAFLPWEIWVAFPCGKPAAAELCYPTYNACWVF